MCGRYTLIKLSDFTDMFPWIRGPEEPVGARYNIAPTQSVAIVPNDGKNQVEFAHWGLIPSWAKDASIGNRTINARAETLADKPMFRKLIRARRCLVPADGFYEWKKNADQTKTPMYIRLKSARPFAFAGLWDSWRDPEGKRIPSCTIITTEPNALVKSIHNRMPVILPEQACRRWIDPADHDAGDLSGLLCPYDADEMEAYAVSREVNRPGNESTRLIERAEPILAQGKRSRGRKSAGNPPGLFDQPDAS
ncbi:MAG: SOS response-associated peptidase [Tepidisphaeraceae bacterium]